MPTYMFKKYINTSSDLKCIYYYIFFFLSNYALIYSFFSLKHAFIHKIPKYTKIYKYNNCFYVIPNESIIRSAMCTSNTKEYEKVISILTLGITEYVLQ